MDTNGRRVLSSLYMLVKILLLVSAAGKATIISYEYICLLCSTAIILYGLALLIYICSYFIVNMCLGMYLNTLQISIICSRYLLHLSVQQLNRFTLLKLQHWIFKEVLGVIAVTTIVNALVNYTSVQNGWFENYIQRFVMLAIIFCITMSLEFIGQYKGALRRFFATIIILTTFTGDSMFFTLLFWSSVFSSIYIAVHIFVIQFTDYVLCCTNEESTFTPQHILERNKLEKTTERSLNNETGDAALHKEGMVNELVERAKVSDVNEGECNMEKESFKRKRDLFETGNESPKKVIRGQNIQKSRTKQQSLKNADETDSERVFSEQNQSSKISGFPFEHYVPSKIDLMFNTGSINSNSNEDLNTQVEPSTKSMSKPADAIKVPYFERELVFPEEMLIFYQQTNHKIENVSIVSDLVQFYESSSKACQSKCLVKNGAANDDSLCKYSTDLEMPEKAEHKSVQQVDAVINDAIEKSIQTCQNLSYTDVKADSIKIEHDEPETYFCGKDETSLYEAKTEFDCARIAETDFRNDNSNFKHDLSTDNVVNEIDIRFIYSLH